MIAAATLHLLFAASVLAADPGPVASDDPHVRVSARIVVLDHETVRRAGVYVLAVGEGRIRVEAYGRRPPRGMRAARGEMGAQAFLEIARNNRWVRSESTQHVLVLSGSHASLSSSHVAIGGYGSRASGPELFVTPTVLEDGRVHLRVDARMADVSSDRRGYPVDGSPVAVSTEVVVEDGGEAVVASGSAAEATRDAGILFRGQSEREREVLIILTPHVER